MNEINRLPDDQPGLNELSDPLRRAVEYIRSQPAPQESMQRAVDRVSLYVQNGVETLDMLGREGVSLKGAYLRPGNLEDVFLKLTGRSLRE